MAQQPGAKLLHSVFTHAGAEEVGRTAPHQLTAGEIERVNDLADIR